MEYRNKVFLPALKEFEKRMAKYERFDLDMEEESQIFKKLCQFWKKAREELSFNIMMNAASMPMMMPETCGELFHQVPKIFRSQIQARLREGEQPLRKKG